MVTADQVKALIEQGTELPYQTGGNQQTAPSIAFRKATLKLEVTPQITPEGNIIMDVDVNKDSVGQQTSAGFAINPHAVRARSSWASMDADSHPATRGPQLSSRGGASPQNCDRVDSYSSRASSRGNLRSLLPSSSTFTSLKVSTVTELTKRSER